MNPLHTAFLVTFASFFLLTAYTLVGFWAYHPYRL